MTVRERKVKTHRPVNRGNGAQGTACGMDIRMSQMGYKVEGLQFVKPGEEEGCGRCRRMTNRPTVGNPSLPTASA
jgi:hypothetical protein